MADVCIFAFRYVNNFKYSEDQTEMQRLNLNILPKSKLSIVQNA